MISDIYSQREVRMKTFIATLSLGLAVSAAADANNSKKIELDPGLYAYNTSVHMAGQLVHTEDPYEYCLTAEDTHTTLGELTDKLVEGGDCSISNQQVSANSASADMSCFIEDFGMTVTGRIEGQYTSTSYEVTGSADLPFGKMVSKTTASRTGACPADWTPPPGISKD